MTRWTAVYRLHAKGRSVASVEVRPAKEGEERLLGESGWRVTWTLSRGRPADVRVLQDLGESPEIDTRRIRRLLPDQALRRFRQQLPKNELVVGLREFIGNKWRQLVEDAASKDIALATHAALYVQAINAGDRTPVKRVASQLGEEAWQARDAIYKARQRGFLGPRDKAQGRARGALTRKAQNLLDRWISASTATGAATAHNATVVTKESVE
jgi:hypothetical protein